MKRVLHLTEAFGGGVQSALISYVAASESLPVKHSLVARSRTADDTKQSSSHLFERLDICSGSLFDFVAMCQRTVKELQPDVVHLHSSFAGFIFRFLRFGSAKVVYTPHCYAFERQDINSSLTFLYRNLERLMLKRIDVIAGCSQRENRLADQLGASTTYLNNYAEFNAESVCRESEPERLESFNVVIVGRVSPQKDPSYIIKVLDHLKTLQADAGVCFTWVGGGDAELERLLINAGVKVTGMLPRQQVMERIASADLYLHSAAWEGMPLTLLEAAKLNCPILCRRIGATEELPCVVSSAEEMASKIKSLKTGDKVVSEFCNNLVQYINGFFTRERQEKVLRQLYCE